MSAGADARARYGQQVPRLLAALAQLAEQAPSVPGIAASLCATLGASECAVWAVLHRARTAGLVRVQKQGRSITGIEAADGSWVLRIAPPPRPAPAAPAPAAPAARPQPAFAALLAVLVTMAEQGRCLTNVEEDLSMALDIDGQVLRERLRRAEKSGRLRTERRGPVITAIMAPDGAWRVPVHPARTVAASRPARRCLRCRDGFHPEHSGRFLCDPCNAYAQANG
jgi:hypothetical protein